MLEEACCFLFLLVNYTTPPRLQALPGTYRPWMLLDGLLEALSDASCVAGAVESMRALPALFSTALVPQACCTRSPEGVNPRMF